MSKLKNTLQLFGIFLICSMSIFSAASEEQADFWPGPKQECKIDETCVTEIEKSIDSKDPSSISKYCCKQIVIDNKRICWDDAIAIIEDVRKIYLESWADKTWKKCLNVWHIPPSAPTPEW
ncbi:hypothetical protein ACHQM5_028315 [Ranunculus cassubicifolius]